MTKLNEIKSKRFVIRKSLIGKNQVITFTNKKGDEITYNHDVAFNIMKSTLENLNCWAKYKVIQQLITFQLYCEVKNQCNISK